jgi:hypothetical protein
MAERPSGTVTFLPTDIESSTRLRGGYVDVLAEHQRLLPTLTRHAPPKHERDEGRPAALATRRPRGRPLSGDATRP